MSNYETKAAFDLSNTQKIEPGHERLIEVSDLTVTFTNKVQNTAHTVLDNVSLSVKKGEFLVLVGRSGCGKTTLLNCIAGLINQTSGSISVGGKTPRAMRREMGYMFARDALMPWRSALRNVEFPLEIRGEKAEVRRERALEMLGRVQLGEAAKKLPWQLSQGMRQRVALARTWVSKPQLLLMDEPFAALDAQTKLEVRKQFLDLWSQHRQTVVFVTHDISEALLMADRIILLKDGRFDLVVEPGFEHPRDPETLVHTEKFRALEHDLSARLH